MHQACRTAARSHEPLRDERGFTLVEVLVAAAVLLVGVLGLLTLLDTANAGTAAVRAREGATTLARQATEAARKVPYAALAPQSIEPELRAQPGLAGQGGGSWVVQRRGVRYEVSATVCTVDDPADGTGPHDTASFCPGVTAGQADRHPDDYKRVRVEVVWGSASSVKRVQQVALVNNPGGAGGPAVREVALASPATSPVTADVATVGLGATTSTPAATVAWSVDGVQQAAATGPSTSWTFAWPVSGLVDGTHLVTAQAFDRAGASGATRSLTLTLNRFVPAAPSGLAAGRNGSLVELEWLPNAERDVVGYRVYRLDGDGGAVAVCSAKRETACQDAAPPDGALTYRVVALDLDPEGQRREGAPSEPAVVTAGNRAPHPPPELQATNDGAVTTLRWTAPSPADPDGEDIAFYRVYRDGTAFADRYDRTGTGAELTLADSRTDGVEHRYWVVAVDRQLAESVPVGPVVR